MRGRNNNGHITSRNMSGGGHKKMYRLVDFYRKKIDMPGNVERIEYDPNRSCYIMLVSFGLVPLPPLPLPTHSIPKKLVC